MTRRPFLLIVALGIALLLSLSGCRPEGVDGPVSYVFARIVTFTGNDASGHARFEFVPQGSAETIGLTSSMGLDTGDRPLPLRLYIRYSNASNSPLAPGDIDLLSAQAITSGDVTLEWDEAYDSLADTEVYLYTISLAGEYVDLRIGLPYSTEKRYFALALAPGTETDDVPELRLVHGFAETPPPTFDRTYYASFSLEPLLQLRPDLQRVSVRVDNSNLSTDLFTLQLVR